jgi:hypothetical protein
MPAPSLPLSPSPTVVRLTTVDMMALVGRLLRASRGGQIHGDDLVRASQCRGPLLSRSGRPASSRRGRRATAAAKRTKLPRPLELDGRCLDRLRGIGRNDLADRPWSGCRPIDIPDVALLGLHTRLVIVVRVRRWPYRRDTATLRS